MRSATTRAFWKCFEALPPDVQRLAGKNYRLWRENPSHPSLHFKPISPNMPIYSVRIGAGFRAIGAKTGETIVWYWIGSHAEYDRVIRGS